MSLGKRNSQLWFDKNMYVYSPWFYTNIYIHPQDKNPKAQTAYLHNEKWLFIINDNFVNTRNCSDPDNHKCDAK